MIQKEQDALRQFFGAYFHEDWPMDAGGPDEVVASFLREGRSAEELSRLAQMIDAYAAMASDDAALERALFTDLWCYYIPSADGVGARAWLRHVANLIRAAAQGK
jgi:hypothetical protein